MTTTFSLRGPALLFCPGDRPDRFAKAVAAADTVILDLEDAVGPDRKSAARDAVVDALSGLDPAAVLVRINAPGTPCYDDDVRALAAHPEVAVMVPMAARAADVEALAPHPVVALCETARGVLAAADIAAVPGVTHLAMGGVDLRNDLNLGEGDLPTLPIRSHLVICSRAAGIAAPIDSVFPRFTDDEALRAEATFARSTGFFGKSAIHPRQLPVLHEVFSPTEHELAWARQVVAAFDTAGGAAVALPDGEMVDLPVADRARRLLDLAADT